MEKFLKFVLKYKATKNPELLKRMEDAISTETVISIKTEMQRIFDEAKPKDTPAE